VDARCNAEGVVSYWLVNCPVIFSDPAARSHLFHIESIKILLITEFRRLGTRIDIRDLLVKSFSV
jgi:hypothetical protein